MTRKTTLALITLAGLLAGPTAFGQSIYHCTDPATGKPVFSQIPCAPDAQEVEAHYHRPTAEQVEASRRLAEQQRREVEDGIRRRRELEAEAARIRAIEAAEADRARRIAEIRAQRARAANNQAGATWEQALSQDEANANARYDAEMRRLRGE
jgi:hypothetical protein